MIVLILFMFPVLVYADTSIGSVTLDTSFTMNEEDIILEEDAYSLMLVAEYMFDETSDTWEYVMKPEYDQYDCEWEELGDSERNEVALEIEEYIDANALSYDFVGITDASGMASFEEIPFGLYLVSRTRIDTENVAYSFQPFFLELPLRVEDEEITEYIINVKLKVETDSVPEIQDTEETEFPMTGDTSRVLLLLVVMNAMIVMGAIYKILYSKKKI